MSERKYLNEEEYQKNNAKVRKTSTILLVVGIAMFVVGLVLVIIGFSGFGSSITNNNVEIAANRAFTGMGMFAIGGVLNAFGLFIGGLGAMLKLMSYRREITAYSAQQVMPVAKEGVEEVTPTVAKAAEKMAPAAGKVAEEVAKGIKKGLKDEK